MRMATVNCKELDKSDCFRESHYVFTGLTLRVIFEAGHLWEIEVHESEILV